MVFAKVRLCCGLLGLMAGCSKQVQQAPPLAGSLKPVRVESQSIDQKRVIYPNSVIPGGVKTAGDVIQAMFEDPVVRKHYGNVRPDLLVPAVLAEDRPAFVSYRVANRVYWTAKRVQLKKGETVLAGGGVTIRGRCGNQVSENPQEPVESGFLVPTEEELDTPVELRGPLELTQAVQGPMFTNLPISAPMPAALEEAVAASSQLLAGVLPQGGGYAPSSAIGGFGGAGGGGMPSETSSTPPVSNSPGSGHPGGDPPGRYEPPTPFHFKVPPPTLFPPSSGPPPSGPPEHGPPPPYKPPTGGPPPSTPPPPPTGWPPPGNPPPGSPPPGLPPYHPPGLPPHGPPPPYDPPSGPPPSGPPPVESIPEPATYFLTAVGLIGFALYGRSKKAVASSDSD